MFLHSKPKRAAIDNFIRNQRDQQPSHPEVGMTRQALNLKILAVTSKAPRFGKQSKGLSVTW
jgi:hypothetical protein